MVNKFSEANAGKREPIEIRKGTLVQWTRADFTGDYDPSLYRLQLRARSSDGKSEIELTSSEGTDGDHLFSASSSVTGSWFPGEYYFQVEVERISDGERVDAYSGRFIVLPDLDLSGDDPRSHAELMLDKIESILEGRADKDVSSYSINGRSLTKLTIEELMDWRGRYRAEVQALRAKESRKQGRIGKHNIQARFV